MSGIWIFALAGGAFALFLLRSALIAFWPESRTAVFCEFNLGVLDSVGDRGTDPDACDGGDGGGD